MGKIPIIGQECLCPDGLGRVVGFEMLGGRVSSIKVETYVNNRGCKWGPNNVKLKPMRWIDE
jgi:hypothetical protein